MTKLGIRIEDVPSTIGWSSACRFVRHLPPDSAVSRHLMGDAASFMYRTPWVLADIFDALAVLHLSYLKRNGSPSAQPAQPYPRPGAKPSGQSFGKGAIKISDFDDWYYGGDSDG